MLVCLQKNQERLVAPLMFLVVCVLAFGVQITQLGYYLDDWIILNAYNLGGPPQVFEYSFLGNRPLVSWLWIIGFKLLNSSPAYWQVWALAWRWLTVLILWKVMLLIWPNAFRQVTLVSLLFAVYPLFKQQASALTYSFHWICFFLWGLSIYWMILAIRQPKRFSLWMGLSVLAGIIQLFSQEFFVGLELLRPFFIWLALAASTESLRNRLKRTLFYWLPFLLAFIGFLLWRMKFMPTPGTDRNTPEILYQLFSSPLNALPKFLVMFLQDMVQTILGIWSETYKPDLFVLSPVSNMIAWALALLAFAVPLVFFLRYSSKQGKNAPLQPGPQWFQTAIPFGVIATICGFLPGWMIGRHIYDLTGIYNDRFGLASMFGAALLIVGLIELLLKTELYRLVLICLLIGLGTGQNYRYERNYRWSWEKQLRLYWQLKWRAPDLEKPTAIYGEGSLISYMGSWTTTSALVQLYANGQDPHFMNQWYIDLTKIDVNALEENVDPISLQSNFMQFKAPFNNSLVIAFQPEKGHCLWVLGEQDRSNPYLSPNLSAALPYSNLHQILPVSTIPVREDIFGKEPAHDWCYYFQQADLARQQQDWQAVAKLWDAAEQNGKRPYVGTEYGAFIEGFAHLGDWDTAVSLTRKAAFPKYEMRGYLCSTWRRIADSTGATSAKQQILDKVIESYECRDEFQ
jgi:hypothetical protein